MNTRPPETDLEKIAVMQRAGVPFDIVTGLFTDWNELENDIKIRGMVGEYPTHRPIEKLALIVLAYYRPERLFGWETLDSLEVPDPRNTNYAEGLDQEKRAARDREK